MRMALWVTLVLGVLASSPGAGFGQNYSNDRMEEQHQSTEKLLETERNRNTAPKDPSDSLLGRAASKAGESISANLPSGGEVSSTAKSWWKAAGKWCSEKWQAVKDWWYSPRR